MIVTMSRPSKVLAAGQFKAKCLELMDQVERTGQDIVITKRGRPVARLAPLRDAPATLHGLLAGQIVVEGDLLAPLDMDWTLR
jgi:prevent-host-death family protein